MLTVLLVLCAAVAFAGTPGYYFQELMYSFNGADSVLSEYTLLDGSGGHLTSPHSVVVDPEGKVWVGFYYGYSGQMVNAIGDTLTLRGAFVFNPDGTPASFSPIEYLEFDDGSKDTIYAESMYNGSCRGMSAMANGDILYTAWSTIYRIDYQTGEGVARWYPPMDGFAAGSMTEAAHDPELGLIYAGHVSANKPIYVLDEDLAYVGTAVDTCPTLHRSIVARTKDGVGQIFSGTIWNGQGIFVYESEDPEFEMFELVDTIANTVVETDSNTITYKAWPSCLDWVDADAGLLIYGNYASAKVTTDVGTAPAASHASTWVLYNVDTKEEVAVFGAAYPVDEFGSDVTATTANDELGNQPATYSPRGASVIADGDKYRFVIADFDLSLIQLVVWSADGVEGNDRYVPYGFSLEQNYPNPFNPSTSISFNIPESYDVSVDVYDLAGAKVATVYNGMMEAGNHNMTFDASDLASGTYVYKLTAGEFSVSKKMTLVK